MIGMASFGHHSVDQSKKKIESYCCDDDGVMEEDGSDGCIYHYHHVLVFHDQIHLSCFIVYNEILFLSFLFFLSLCNAGVFTTIWLSLSLSLYIFIYSTKYQHLVVVCVAVPGVNLTTKGRLWWVCPSVVLTGPYYSVLPERSFACHPATRGTLVDEETEVVRG